MENWFVICPRESKETIKSEFEKLGLEGFTVSIIVINDGLSKEEENEYVEFINKNLDYSGQIDASSLGDLNAAIENMGGSSGDSLHTIKNGKVTSKKLVLE